MSITMNAEMARLEQMLAESHARNADASAKFPVRRTAPHAAGTPFTPANAGAITTPPSCNKPAEAGTHSESPT